MTAVITTLGRLLFARRRSANTRNAGLQRMATMADRYSDLRTDAGPSGPMWPRPRIDESDVRWREHLAIVMTQWCAGTGRAGASSGAGSLTREADARISAPRYASPILPARGFVA